MPGSAVKKGPQLHQTSSSFPLPPPTLVQLHPPFFPPVHPTETILFVVWNMAADKLSDQAQSLSLEDKLSSSPETQGLLTPPASSEDESSKLRAKAIVSDAFDDLILTVPPPGRLNSLLDLPEDILRKIYAYVLVEYVESDPPQLKVAAPRYMLGTHDQNIDGDHHMPYYTNLSPHARHLGLKRSTISLLLVSTQVYDEAAPILYGSYQFRSTSAESSRVGFTKHIGVVNTKAIRRLCLGLPHALKTMPSRSLGLYLHMLEDQMPELQEFKITTLFDRWRYAVTQEPRNVWIENHRGLLWTAAWATRNHKLLKYAVWNEWDTVSDGKIGDEIYLKPRWDDRPSVVIEVTITKGKPVGLQEADRPEEIEKRNGVLINGEEPELIQPVRGLLLDCYKIRRTRFVGLSTSATCRPYNYQVDLNQSNVTSESSKPIELPVVVQIEELFLHNKHPQRLFSISNPPPRSWYLKARALESANIAQEMLMKNGPPPAPEPSVHGGDDNDNGWGGNEGWGGPGNGGDDDWNDDNDNSHDWQPGDGYDQSQWSHMPGGGNDSEADDEADGYSSHEDEDYEDEGEAYVDDEDSDMCGSASDHDNDQNNVPTQSRTELLRQLGFDERGGCLPDPVDPNASVDPSQWIPLQEVRNEDGSQAWTMTLTSTWDESTGERVWRRSGGD